jgi:diguanylate cyclase (GGDEF)-like protein
MASMHQMFVHAALRDSLTGVYNRAGFERAVQSAFAARDRKGPASIVMIDLDHFKPVNDTAGHAAGDAVLVEITRAISAQARASDVVARLGGDEFAVLLPSCDQHNANLVAEKVRQAITDRSVPFQGRQLQVGASLGVVELSASHQSVAEWIADADRCCYQAKRAGRGVVVSADSPPAQATPASPTTPV